MTKVSEVMTRDVVVISPEESLKRAAQLMDERNVGVPPVCDGRRLVGMITDRDITVRATSAGQAPEDTKVSEAMTAEVHYCFESDDISKIEQAMGDVQIRRLPVIDTEHNLIGILALGDLATKEARGVAETLEEISRPSRPGH